jgi:hypothetical protein
MTLYYTVAAIVVIAVLIGAFVWMRRPHGGRAPAPIA